MADLTFILQLRLPWQPSWNTTGIWFPSTKSVHVAQEALAAATRLYEDNQRQVAVGTAAPWQVSG